MVFLNAPVLFKEGGKTFQQIVAGYKSDTLGEISFAYEGKELLNAKFQKGENSFLLTFPAVSSPKRINIATKIDNRPLEKDR